MSIVDLSVTINEATPIYPGDPSIKIEPAGVFDRDGWCDHYVSMGTHVGTHIDAPMHMLADGKSLDQMPIGQFVGRGICIDVSDNNFDGVKSANIQSGDIVLLHTGMGNKYHEPVYFETYPVMPEEVIKHLVDLEVKMVGIDACSVDNADGFPNHKLLLGSQVLIIENLTNLAELIGKQFRVYALPLKLGVDGAPARVIADV